MKPKNHNDFKEGISTEVGVHKEVVDDFITYYYAQVRKALANLSAVNIYVEGLGTFSMKKNKIEKNMTICKFCDTKITKNHLAEHQTTRKCLNIRKTKKLSAYSGKLQTSDIKLQVDKMKNFNNRNSKLSLKSANNFFYSFGANILILGSKSNSHRHENSNYPTIATILNIMKTDVLSLQLAGKFKIRKIPNFLS